MRRILVTGATSFVGISLAAKILNSGVCVDAIVRPQTDLSKFEEFGIHPNFLVHGEDQESDAKSLAKLIEISKPDAVIHIAGHYVRNHQISDIEALTQSNIVFGCQLLEAMKMVGINKIVATGSYFQFYDGPDWRPVNLYAATKQAFDAILKFYIDAYDFRALSLIIYDTYGPLDWRPRLMPAIREAQLLGKTLSLPSKNLPIDMVHIDDICDAFILAMEQICTSSAPLTEYHFSLCSGNEISIADLITLFTKIGKQPVITDWGAYPDPPRMIDNLWFGPSLPGWNIKISLEDGIEEFLAKTSSDQSQ